MLAGHEDVDVDAGVVPSNKQDELAVPTELSATIVRVESDADESISHPAESVLKVRDACFMLIGSLTEPFTGDS